MILIKVKLMPTSPETNLDKIKEEAEKKVSGFEKAKLHAAEQEDVAFGLKALILTVTWPENKDSEELEKAMQSIEEVSSVQVIDVRKAIG